MFKPAVMKLLGSTTRYEMLLMFFVIIALLSVIGIWLWLGFKTQQLEQEIYKMNW